MKRIIDEAEWFPVLVLYEETDSYPTDIQIEFTPEFLESYQKAYDAFEWIQSCLRTAWDFYYEDEKERKENDSPD